MQQDTFYRNFPQEARLQCPNADFFQPQSNRSSWTGNFMPQVNLSLSQNVPNPFNFGNQVQPNITPASTAAYGSTTSFSWAHTVPSLMPWVTQGDQQIPDPVMRFTAPFPPDPCTSQTATSWELLNNLGANKTNVNMHLKRKGDLDILESTPYKRCITEEKMAARLKELHISNQYSVPTESPFGLYNNSSNNAMAEKSVTNLQQLEAMLKSSGSEGAAKSLILAPEIKQLVEPEKIFSTTFLEKVERPSMAVVLWQPQSTLLTNMSSTVEDPNKDDDEKRSEGSSLLTDEIENNNYLNNLPPSLTNAIRNQNLFTMGTSQEASDSVNSEDVMDT